MFVVGFLAMAVAVWVSIAIAFRSRPVYAKLNSQLDRYQQVIEPLRRLAMYGIPVVLGIFVGRLDGDALDHGAAVPEPHAVRHRPTRSSTSTSRSTCTSCRSTAASSPTRRPSSLIAGLAALATCYLYGGIRISGREVRVTRPRASSSPSPRRSTSRCRRSASGSTSTRPSPTARALITGAGVHRRQRDHPGPGDPGRHRRARRGARSSSPRSSAAGACRSSAPLCWSSSSLVIGGDLPGDRPATPGRARARARSRRRTSSATSTRRARPTASTDVNVQAVRRRRPTPSTGALREDAETTANIRILDPALVSDTFSQLQQVRQYYQFPQHLDVDRYTIDGQDPGHRDRGPRARAEPGQSSNTWYNNTLVYTHGYGVVAAYGNQRSERRPAGVPRVGHPVDGRARRLPAAHLLRRELARVLDRRRLRRASKDVELDYPSGGDSDERQRQRDDDVRRQRRAEARQLLQAARLRDQVPVRADPALGAVTDDSQILYDRDPIDRVQKVAPYLTLDSDTYPAVVDGQVVWIVDGYTTTADYPYSRIEQLSSRSPTPTRRSRRTRSTTSTTSATR